MALGGGRALVEPLTRSTKAGSPYARSPEVETQLEGLLRASADEQFARAKDTDKNSPRYLADECLVYLVRQAGLGNESERYHTLVALLLKRVTRGIERKLRALGVTDDDVDDMHQEVVISMITSILEGSSGEFYQVRFRSALYRQLIKRYDQYASRRRARRERSLEAPLQNGDGENGQDDATLGELLESHEDVAADVERRLLIADALKAIANPDHRKAFVLHHYYGWKIESTDPSESTLAQIFDRTPRMVRIWLRTADRQLADWRAMKRA